MLEVHYLYHRGLLGFREDSRLCEESEPSIIRKVKNLSIKKKAEDFSKIFHLKTEQWRAAKGVKINVDIVFLSVKIIRSTLGG